MAASLAAELGDEFDADVELIPSGGGVFEVTVDGDLVYSKKSTGRHAEPGEVAGLIRECS
ncbi:Rdx family protein [bacterium]|nr:Rdx family protein [bacterium]MBU1074191.1 Rdx family protein [bacterium]MBU1674805.1 Rdx family protein [bacterium]